MAIVATFLGAAPAMASNLGVAADGVLAYDAALGETNQLAISGDSASLTINDTGTPLIEVGQGCTAVDAQTATCVGATSIVVRVGDLDDTVKLTTALPSSVEGQDGNDTINGGDGDDILSGGPGSDLVTYTTVATGVTVDLALGQATGAGTDTLAEIENVYGSTGPDHLTGNADPNSLVGSGGDDVLIVTGGGADTVNCGTGVDTAYLDITDTIIGVDSCEVDPAPQTEIIGPSGGAVISNPAPEFSLSSPSPDLKEFLCRFNGEDWFICPATFIPDPPLADGPYTLEAIASDQAGNVDQTPASVSFVVDTTVKPGPGDGPPPNPSPGPAAPSPNATGTKIVIGSLVLISGNAVKMSRKGRISISLTCAGASKCTGRLSITTAEPVKKGKKLVTLGAKKFTIGPNKKRKVYVKFSKRNIRLAKRLKRFKAKALIREIDNRGNLRLSSRLFTLRAR